MRCLALASVLSLAAAVPALAGPPSIRATLPADHLAAQRRGAFMMIHTFHHADPMPFAEIRGTAEGLVGGVRRSLPLTISYDSTTTTAAYLIPRTWPDSGVWVLNIEGRFDMGAGLVIGVGREGVPVLVQTPRTAVGISRPATAREVDALLRYLNGERAAPPALVDARWRLFVSPPFLRLLGVVLSPALLAALILAHVRRRRAAPAMQAA